MSLVGKSTQRYSRFDPRLVGDCIGWFDGADSNSFTLAGSSVSVWSNKVPTAFLGQIGNLTSNAAASAPQRVANGVSFNGTTQFLRALSWSAVPANSAVYPGVGNGESVFFVGTFTGPGTTTADFTILGASAVSGGTGNGPRGLIVRTSGAPLSNSFQWVRYGTSIGGAPVASITSNVRFLAAAINDASTATTSGYTNLNGTRSPATTATGYAYSPIPYTLVGARNVTAPGLYYTGTMNELLVYSWINSNDVKRVEGYLAWKWGLVASLVAGHPYTLAPPLTSVFDPTTLPGCALWLDGADQSSMTFSGANVTVWSDKSGNNRHASNGTSPTIASNGVVFNGTTQYLATPYTSTLTASGETVFVVATNTATSGIWRSMIGPSLSNTTSNGRGVSFNASSTTKTAVVSAACTGTSITSVSAGPRGEIALVTGVFKGAAPAGGVGVNGSNYTFSAFLNGSGVALTTWPAGTANTLVGAGFQTGALGSFFQGTIHEIVIYNRSPSIPNSANTTVLSSYELRRVQSYLAAKWNLNTLMSANHYSKLTPSPGIVGNT